MRKTRCLIFFFLLISCSFLLSGCSCEHSWRDATCTRPEICSKCGEHQGSPLGHDWQDATCTQAKTCEMCGMEEGAPLDHK